MPELKNRIPEGNSGFVADTYAVDESKGGQNAKFVVSALGSYYGGYIAGSNPCRAG